MINQIQSRFSCFLLSVEILRYYWKSWASDAVYKLTDERAELVAILHGEINEQH